METALSSLIKDMTTNRSSGGIHRPRADRMNTQRLYLSLPGVSLSKAASATDRDVDVDAAAPAHLTASTKKQLQRETSVLFSSETEKFRRVILFSSFINSEPLAKNGFPASHLKLASHTCAKRFSPRFHFTSPVSLHTHTHTYAHTKSTSCV